MSRRAKQSQMEAPGQDSFLDVVANLVGIILILIMVVGSQVKKAYLAALEQAPPAAPAVPPPSPLAGEAAAAEAAAAAIERDFQALAAKMSREQFEINYRRTERDRIATLVAAGKATLDEQRGELTAAQQEEYDLFARLNVARRELRDLKLAKDAVKNAPATPGIIEHLPTPLAKTVFGKELHVRLKNGKITYVPINELADRLKTDWKSNAWKLQDSDSFTETIGPLDGFRMRYTLIKEEGTVATPNGGVARGARISLEKFILIPVADDLGEPLEMALAPGSGLRSLLRDYPPERTTVTVWVYPESFEQFRALKAELFQLGYATAGRPLPDGFPIGGSPDGSHSSAQ